MTDEERERLIELAKETGIAALKAGNKEMALLAMRDIAELVAGRSPETVAKLETQMGIAPATRG